MTNELHRQLLLASRVIGYVHEMASWASADIAARVAETLGDREFGQLTIAELMDAIEAEKSKYISERSV